MMSPFVSLAKTKRTLEKRLADLRREAVEAEMAVKALDKMLLEMRPDFAPTELATWADLIDPLKMILVEEGPLPERKLRERLRSATKRRILKFALMAALDALKQRGEILPSPSPDGMPGWKIA